MFEKLVAPVNQCRDLIKAGIRAESFFTHYKTGESPEAWQIALTGTMTGYESVPAWTKEELDTMLGNQWPKPDFTEAKARTLHSPDLEYSISFPGRMLLYKTGSQASAAALLFLIQNDHIDADEATERRQTFFNDDNG